jgi:hypothetical protein
VRRLSSVVMVGVGCDLTLLKALTRPDVVVEARGTQDLDAAQRSGGEEQCIAAAERPAPGAGRGQWGVGARTAQSRE